MSPSTIRFSKLCCASCIRFLCISFTVLFSVWLACNAYNGYQKLSDEANIAKLNQKVTKYKEEVGKLPDLNLIDLYHKGLTNQRLHRTPFGGYYRLDPIQSSVYNPNIASR